jgi:FkbM family methyltransferase
MRIRTIIHSKVICKLPRRYQLFVERLYFFYCVKNYVENEVRIIRRFCDSRKASLDIGANRGQLTLFLSAVSSHVYCFEPVPWLSEYLKQRFRGCNVSVEDCALGNVNDELLLRIPWIGNERLETRSSLVNDFANDHIRGAKVTRVDKVEIKVRRLDDFRMENVGFMKVDVEGYEVQVLEGAIDTIERCRPNMLIEIEQRDHPEKDVKDVFRCILDMGYSGYFVHKGKLMGIGEFDVMKMQCPSKTNGGDYVSNFLFLNRSVLQHGAGSMYGGSR